MEKFKNHNHCTPGSPQEFSGFRVLLSGKSYSHQSFSTPVSPFEKQKKQLAKAVLDWYNKKRFT